MVAQNHNKSFIQNKSANINQSFLYIQKLQIFPK